MKSELIEKVLHYGITQENSKVYKIVAAVPGWEVTISTAEYETLEETKKEIAKSQAIPPKYFKIIRINKSITYATCN